MATPGRDTMMTGAGQPCVTFRPGSLMSLAKLLARLTQTADLPVPPTRARTLLEQPGREMDYRLTDLLADLATLAHSSAFTPHQPHFERLLGNAQRAGRLTQAEVLELVQSGYADPRAEAWAGGLQFTNPEAARAVRLVGVAAAPLMHQSVARPVVDAAVGHPGTPGLAQDAAGARSGPRPGGRVA